MGALSVFRAHCLAMAAACLLAATPAQALVVKRSDRVLKDVPTQLVVNAAVPSTVLRPQATGGQLAVNTPETRLGSSRNQPATVLREAEIPPQRLELTRTLLSELKARQTPEQAISIDLPADVLFDFDKADLRPDSAGPLDKAAELIRSYPAAPLRVVGHTDGKGTDAYNDSLSDRRAQAVANALRERTSRQAHTEGMGKRQPVAANTTPDGRDDPEGRQRNRRVQVLLQPPSVEGGVAAR
jgi:outer membrane protein OmpA-like peptidoglycan-associated protein